ncbi:hypothetical protein V7O66_06605 [Methanolobus sp. ZRKC3]|uniref:hypothetical protein n=1 Tax=Methanolobus sp. ZRKC3 TaxID=3125786 RepID=UPI0032475A5F
MKDGEMLAQPMPVATNLSFPEGLAVDVNLLIAETGTGSLSKIDLQTRDISNIAENLEVGVQAILGVSPTYIFNSVDVSPSGTIYVTGDISNILYHINAN